MKKRVPFLRVSLTLATLLALAMVAASGAFAALPAATSPTLGAAAAFSVLGATTVTNTGPTITGGAVGVSPGIAIVGFPPGTAGGGTHANDASAIAAQAANIAAFTALDQGCDTTYAGVQDLTLVSPLGPGTYCAPAFILTGNLTLSGSGVWIFKSASTLITSPQSSVTGGDPCNVWWRVGSSATLDTATSFIGNILALTSITLNNGASLGGRALAQTGAVTLINNSISGPICAGDHDTEPRRRPRRRRPRLRRCRRPVPSFLWPAAWGVLPPGWAGSDQSAEEPRGRRNVEHHPTRVKRAAPGGGPF